MDYLNRLVDPDQTVIERLEGLVDPDQTVIERLDEEVFLVEHKSEGTLTVLKTKAESEGKILAHLSHPNIVRKVADFEAVPGSFIMEYCDLGSLDDLIEFNAEQKIQESEALLFHIFESLASAINYCHTNEGGSPDGYTVHCDIKPGNILLSSVAHDGKTPVDASFPRVVLADFDCSITERQLRTAGDGGLFLVQDVFYSPPEFEPLNDPKAQDIYQIGLIISCLAYSKKDPVPSFKEGGPERSDYEEIRRLSVGPSYSEALNMIVFSCLDIEPSDRPTSAALLAMIKTARGNIERGENCAVM